MKSLLLFRRAFASPTMCRFIPALSVLVFPAVDSGLGARVLALGSEPTLLPPLCVPAPREDRGKSPDRRLERKSALGDCHAASRGAGDRIPPCGPNAS
jgi:hypothetical protein